MRTPPPGLVRATVCEDSGKLALSGCPVQIEEIFLAARPPAEPCHLHREQTPMQQALENIRGVFGLGGDKEER